MPDDPTEPIFRLPVGRITASVYLTPHKTPDLDPSPAIVAAISSAKTSLHFAAYSLTSKPIAAAIIAAHQRGVTVLGVCDASELHIATSQVRRIVEAGVDVHKWGSGFRLLHSKTIVVDGNSRHAIVGLGSANFTTQSETANQEVFLLARGIQVSRVLAPALTAQIIAAHDSGTAI